MKKTYIISLLVILTSGNIFSQSGWFWQNPLPQGNTLYDAIFVNANKIIAVGEGGAILRSENAGTNWINSNNLNTYYLRSVFFLNDLTGWISAQNKVLKTTDGGINWLVINVPMGRTFESVIFPNSQTGYLVGHSGAIFKSTNGGLNWFQQVSTTDLPLLNGFFIDVNTGWAVGWNGKVLKTINGGAVWDSLPTGFNLRYTSVHFRNANTGLMTSENGNILRSTDGGNNWGIVFTGTPLSTINFYNDNTGWAVGSNIYRTTNAGANWVMQINPTTDYYRSVHFINDQTGIASGNRGTIIKTTTGGDQWVNLVSRVTSTNVQDVCFVNDQTGWCAVRIGELLHTTNGGANWGVQLYSSTYLFNSLSFINQNTGWAAGNNILKTTNQGMNWVNQLTNISVSSIFALDNMNVWASGPNGVILKTQNAGTNWNSLPSGYTNEFRDLFFVNPLTGWVVGSGQMILNTTNGGVSWNLQYGGNWPGGFVSVFFTDNLTGWAAGQNPGNSHMLMKTTNGGLNWNSALVGSLFFTSVHFSNINTGWFSANGDIYNTTDGGSNWVLQGGSVSRLNSIYFINNNTGWAVGDNGTILKTTSSGLFVSLENISAEIPNIFMLSQNYPNPFNPVTNIRFDIPALGSGGDRIVKLIVYDLLGREVAMLVNEQLKPGSYEVDWDGSGFASGVYFYSLVTPDFVETKRMVLIK